jgi:hypothetical protein
VQINKTDANDAQAWHRWCGLVGSARLRSKAWMRSRCGCCW